MKLFESMAAALAGGDQVTLVVIKAADGRLSVSVNPKKASCDSVAGMSEIQPIVVTGTAQELDNGLADMLAAPVADTIGLQSNLAEQAQSLKDAQKAAQKAADTAKAKTPAKTTKPATAKDAGTDGKGQAEPVSDKTDAAADEQKRAEEATAKVSAGWPKFIAAKKEGRWADGLAILKELLAIVVKPEQKTSIENGIKFCEAQLAEPGLGLE